MFPIDYVSLHDMVAVILVGISQNNRFDNEMKIWFYENEGWCEIAKFIKLQTTFLQSLMFFSHCDVNQLFK